MDIIINEILTTPAILIGLFVMIGNVLLKKPLADIISGTFKTIIGFTMLFTGAGIVGGSLEYFSLMFAEAFGLQGVVINTDAWGALLTDTYGLSSIILVVGMILNIFLARFTRFKYIFLAGNISLYIAGMLGMILKDFSPLVTISVGPIVLALYMILSPALTHKYTAEIAGTDEFALANPGNTTYFLAGKLGRLFGDKDKSIDDINVPKSLGFLQDSTVTMSLTMALLFILMRLFIGPEFVEVNLSNGQHYLFFSFMQGITFTVGVLVLMYGINLAVEELTESFKGIGERFIPGDTPAVDAAVMAKYSPNAMIVGFLVSFSTSLVAIMFLQMFNLPITIPSVLLHFFIGGIAATFGNKTGGRRGAIIGAVTNGLMMGILPSIFLTYVGGVDSSIIFGDADYGIIGILVEFFARFFR